MRNEFQPLDAVVINAGVRHECEPTDDILIWRDDGRAETLYEAGSDEEFERPPLEFRALSLLRVACRSIYVGALVLESLLFTLLGLPWVLVVAVLTSGLYPRETFNLVRVVWHFCVTRVGDRGRNLIDYRRPILLLRAHDDDNVMVDDTIDTNPFGLRTPGEFQRERVVPSESPFEEVIAKALTRFGPLVALRTKKQKERRFQFRKYLVHYNDWQRQILHWIDNSQLIVVLIGTEQSMSDPRWGLGWEISTLIKMNSFHKVILLMPPISEWGAMERWSHYETLIRRLVPNADFGTEPPRPDTNVRADLRRVRLAVVDQNWRHKWMKCESDGASYRSAISRCIRDRAPVRNVFIRLFHGVVQGISVLFGAAFVLAIIGMVGYLAWSLFLQEWVQRP